MSMSEDVARYVKAGLAAEYHEWDRDVFIDRMGSLLKVLRADRAAVPRLRLGVNEAGTVVVWHYLARPGEVSTQSHGECHDDECFDISVPCPPDCG
jgi:hypothetical protein